MLQVTIKEKFKNKRVAFRNSAAPLFKRTDLDELAIAALESQDQSLLRLFETLPTLAELKKKKTDADLRKIVADNK